MPAKTILRTIYRTLGITVLAASLSTAAQTQTETVLHNFQGLSVDGDGAHPESSLVADPSGNLYGTTRGSWANPDCFRRRCRSLESDK